MTSSFFGQELQSISKAEVLQIVQNNGNRLKIGTQEVFEAKGDLKQANAVYLPSVSASYTGFTTTNPLMAFGSKLNQEVISQSDFNPQMLNDPDRTNNYATKIEVQQPLVNMDGIYQRKAAAAKYKAAQFQFERTSDYLVLEVEKSYMELQLAYKTVSVLEKAHKAALENLKLAQNAFRQGILQRSDVLAAEVRSLEAANQLRHAESNIKNASGYLSVLMNDKEMKLYQPSDSLLVNEELLNGNQLSEERADIQAMQMVTKAYEQQYRSEKMSFLPRLNAFGSYELHDNEFLQADANGYLVGAQLSWDLFDGNKRFGKTQKSRAAYEKSKLEYDQYLAESELEIQKAQRMLYDAKNSLKLSDLALEQSKEALRIRTNRFREGLERMTDLLLAEATFAQKELEYYNTVFQYNYALAYIRFLTKK